VPYFDFTEGAKTQSTAKPVRVDKRL